MCAPVFRIRGNLIEALVFDFDGVIIDTETPDYVTWQEVFQAHGVELDKTLWSRFIGRGRKRFDTIQHLEELVGSPIDRDALGQSRRRRYLDLIDRNPVLPGVETYIDDAKRLGLKLGVASSSSVSWITRHLKARNLLDKFDSIKGLDDVSAAKPDPELYTAAVAALGTVPERAVAIEDSVNGVTAAKAAGLFCVAVTNPMTDDLPVDRADLRLKALSDMPLQELLELASR